MTNSWRNIAFNRGALLDTIREMNPKLFIKAMEKTPEYPQPNKKLMVVPMGRKREIKNFYKDRNNLTIISFGESLTGKQFDEVFVVYPTMNCPYNYL